MKFRSTRGAARELGFSEALLAGLATDGGLYVPEKLPENLASGAGPGGAPPALVELGSRIVGAFAEGDPLATELPGICKRAWDFPVPLKLKEEGPAGLLELFHGPTAAFKDFAARFLSECVQRLPAKAPRLVLVATSGDKIGRAHV